MLEISLLWVYNWGLHWGYSELTIETENAIKINNIRVLTLRMNQKLVESLAPPWLHHTHPFLYDAETNMH